MQDPIEYLTEDQLVHIVVLLEEDKKTEGHPIYCSTYAIRPTAGA